MSLVMKFKEYINNKILIQAHDKLLLGVSGGPDSLSMLDLFMKIKEEYSLDLTVFYLNHMFRKEAAAEAEFVKKTADNYGVKSIIETFDVPAYIKKKGLSPEEAAREIRFKYMVKWADKLKIKKIALAHNKNDFVETILLNLARGTGLKGLSGINPVTLIDGIKIIHPLLSFSRKKIEKYCRDFNLYPVEDPSNKTDIYTRNKIRHNVVPVFEEINPGFKEAVFRMGNIVNQENEFLNKLADKKFELVLLEKEENQISFNLKRISQLDRVLLKRVIEKAVTLVKGDDTDLYYAHYKAAINLIKRGNTGKRVDLKDGIIVRCNYNKVIIETRSHFKAVKSNEKYEFELNAPDSILLPYNIEIKSDKLTVGDIDWKLKAKDNNICICDLDKIKFPLQIRNRRPGDVFYPLGMKGKKKIKDLFIDEKIPLVERDKIPLVLSNDGRVIWITGCRVDNRFKVTEETKNLLKLVIIDKRGD
ncbi:MAG: tRNA lysidine(34) synthetase TilS [bacterium]